MKKRKKKITVKLLIKKESALSEPERVVAFAGMGFTPRQIAIEIGRTEDFIHTNYHKQIEEGIVRGGAMVHKVIHMMAMAGDHSCLSILFWLFNHERYEPLPNLVKDAIAIEEARSPSTWYTFPQNRKKERDSNGRFKRESKEFASEFDSEFERD